VKGENHDMLKHRWRYGSVKIPAPPKWAHFGGGGFSDFSSNFCGTDPILGVKII